ncbi:MAG: hypothetical protein DRJ03_26415 [Chloroflexi bacterium]|nr:MAG: hypothetical protein DRJ03_26415 [Chloroflexota bacterium]
MQLLDKLHWMKGIDPVADAFSGTASTDIVKAMGEGVLFIRYHGVGTTGTSTVTVEACDDTTPSNSTAVAFMYRTCTSGDTWGAWTTATASGFTTTAGSSQMYQIYVDSAELAEEGYGYVRAKFTESVDDPVLGCVLIAIVNQRYGEQPESLD